LFRENANLAISMWDSSYVVGEKKLFELYKQEIDRILKRKYRGKSLRQNRALALLRTEMLEFTPKFNRDIHSEQ
jgi:hypothetical protein